MRRCLASLLVFLFLPLFSIPAAGDGTPPVKNVIFLIGDGMGLAQFCATREVAQTPLALERSTAIGLANTSSASHYVTDSAASGTALATGHKTSNGMVGMLPDGSAVPSLLKLARDQGKATGVVVTCAVTHATPAAFLAHRKSRKLQEDIAEDIATSGVDLLVGGGRQFFEQRSDQRNLSDQLRKDGYTVAYTLADLLETPASGKTVALLADNHLPPVSEGRGNLLEEAVGLALDRLSQRPEGFFLMVEGSQIDWGGHKNQIDYVTSELRDFDKAVALAMNFADTHPGTLVVVTADHETGGLTLLKKKDDAQGYEAAFSTKSHSGTMVPVYAYGTGATAFVGIYENTELFHRIRQSWIPAAVDL